MKLRSLSWILLSCFCVTRIASAASPEEEQSNWHRWRGPLANGVAPNADPPVEWDGQKNVQWKTPLPGRGSGTPIIWGDRVYLTTAVKTDRPGKANVTPSPEPPAPPEQARRRRRMTQPIPEVFYEFRVLAIDRNTGKIVWNQKANEAVPHDSLHNDNTYASASAVTDGEHLYVSFGSYGIYCYDLKGNKKWDRDLGDMHTRAGFGEGASPALHDGTLVVNWDHEGDSFITALDATTGNEKWKVPRDERTTWDTPLIVEAAGKTQVVVNASNRTRSYDLANGYVIWECGGQVGNPIPTPVAKDGIVYCMSGYRGAALYAIPLDSGGDITGSDKILWHADRNTPYVPSPLLYGNRLYFTKGNEGILTVLAADSGETILKPKRLGNVSNIYASPLGAAGRVYIVGRDGTTMVLKHADDYEVLATNRLGEAVDASPAAAGKQLFLRGETHLWCLAEKD